MKHLSLSADLCIHSYWLSQLRQASHRKMIQSSALWRFKILTCPLLKTSKNNTENICYVQGVSHWNVFFNLALRERNIQVRLYLKVVLKCWDVDILIIRTNFQKCNLGWPQQPPTEKVHELKNDISWFHQKKWFSKHQNKSKFNNLDDSGVLSSDFPGLRISVASMTSTASVASMTSTASFHKRNYWVLCFHQPWHQNDLSWSLNVEWIIKNPLFYWFLAPFLLEAVEASLSYIFENWF